MKNLIPKCILLCSLACSLTGFANDKNEADVYFSAVPDIANINCGSKVRNAIFTVTNQVEGSCIAVKPETIINHDDFPNDLVTIQPGDAHDSLTTCGVGDSKECLQGRTSCHINLLIHPAACQHGVVIGDINRTLVVDVRNMQGQIAEEFEFAYTTLGAGDDFAILGGIVSNKGGGPSSAQGDVGHTLPVPITGQYNVTDGTWYKSPEDAFNPVVLAAQNDFATTYATFLISEFFNECKEDYTLPPTVKPGYTCLINDGGVFIDRRDIFLDGTGDYVFFINNHRNTCFKSRPWHELDPSCDLTFGSSVSFTYSDPNTPNRVYWIVGNGTTHLKNGAQIVGTVLAGKGSILDDQTGTGHTHIEGRLWSGYKKITTFGTTVINPE